MAFVKKTWQGRISEYPNRRTITDENGVAKLVTVGRSEGAVSQEGDAFTAANMNDLEQRIYNGFQSGGGGGGGGGHTIIDDSGTSLEQQPGLQFKGAYSEDNDTDSVTEVNIVRSMTRAEFDLLSDDEKVGIINITDEAGNGVYHEYSTSEHIVGKWVNGSTIYEKSFSLGTQSDTDHSYNHNISNFGLLISISGSCTLSTGDKLPLPYVALNSSTYSIVLGNVTSTQFRIQKGSGLGTLSDIYVTIRYTKSSS